MTDYWSMLPEKAKTSKKERFNFIIGVIKGDITLSTSETTQNNPSEENDSS